MQKFSIKYLKAEFNNTLPFLGMQKEILAKKGPTGKELQILNFVPVLAGL
jgi:hypothetical protein